MSSQTTENTGVVPPLMYGENEFNSVNIENENNVSPPAENSAVDNTTAEIATGESLATAEPDNIATAEPINTATAEPENAATAEPEVSASTTKSGTALSSKQTELMRLRAETLEDMRQAYSKRFSDTSKYPKPPKAKAYHASGLTTIRQRDGEEAYKSALNDIMNKNDSDVMSGVRKTRKPKKSSVNSTRNNSGSMSRNTAKTVTSQVTGESIEEMGRAAKRLIDSIIQASKNGANSSRNASLTPYSKTSKARKPRSKTTKKSTAAPLFTVPEETSANMINSVNDRNRLMS